MFFIKNVNFANFRGNIDKIICLKFEKLITHIPEISETREPVIDLFCKMGIFHEKHGRFFIKTKFCETRCFHEFIRNKFRRLTVIVQRGH